jgi:hypothetical protein
MKFCYIICFSSVVAEKYVEAVLFVQFLRNLLFLSNVGGSDHESGIVSAEQYDIHSSHAGAQMKVCHSFITSPS